LAILHLRILTNLQTTKLKKGIMNLAETNNSRYEDQFFLFDQMQYEVHYNLSKPDHSVSENAEPDYGEDLINEEPDSDDFDNDDLNDDEFSGEEE
jgi:hypothetical protein